MEAARLQIDNFPSHSSRFPFTSQISLHYVLLKPVALSSTWQLIRLNIFSFYFSRSSFGAGVNQLLICLDTESMC